MARIKISVIEDYLNLQRNLKTILDAYGMTQKHVYGKLDMHRATWTLKLKKQTFTAHEMLKIARIINK